jgi:predicted AlkP superfamily phosphohydrolase/phosphomutase
MATDQVGHVAWEKRQARRESGEAIDDVLLHTYQLVDAQIGRFLEQIDDRTTVILMSDHGFGSRFAVVDIGAALHEAGIIAYEGSSAVPAPRIRRHGRKGGVLGMLEAAAKAVMPQGLRGRIRESMTPSFDWSRTKAWVWGRYPKLRFNVKGRERNGLVEPGPDLEKLRAETCECLRSITDPMDGRKIIEDIWSAEELYAGAPPGDPPDLVATTRDFGYISRDVVSGGTRAFLTEEAKRSVGWRHEQGGIHRMNGVFVAYGRGVRNGSQVEGASLADVAPTILHLLETPVPRAMDGKVLRDALAGDAAGETVFTDEDPPPQERCLVEGTSEDEAQVAQRLRDLGYVD